MPAPSPRRSRAIWLAVLLAALAPAALFVSHEGARATAQAWLSPSARLGSSDAREAKPEGPGDAAPGSAASRDSAPLPSGAEHEAAARAAEPGAEDPGIEGEGGEGIHRAMRRSGVWFPVHAAGSHGASADPDTAEPAELPLFITSGTPPRMRSGESSAYRFEALGGTPPYRWRMDLAAAEFSLDPATGWLSGVPAAPFALPLAVHVSDAAGAEDSALYTLAADEGEPLRLLTVDLPAGSAGMPYRARLEASGGLAPLAWSADPGLPEEFRLHPSTGQLEGLPSRGLDLEFTARVTDSGGQESARALRLRVVSPIEILSSSPLRPAAPGSPYRQEFFAEGGTPPYRWSLVSGTLPLGPGGQPWHLSEDGVLSGVAPAVESAHRFLLEAMDAEGLAERKEFRLSARRSLIAVPSREKAGLAWSPAELAQSLGRSVAGVTVTRSASPDGSAPAAVVYQGAGTNFVDRGLSTGSTYHYVLHVHPRGGPPVEFAAATVRILPFTLGRGVPGQLADPYADAVKVFRPLAGGGHGAAFVPGNVTGPPDGAGTYSPASLPGEVLSLHARAGQPGASPDAHGGHLILAFEDNIVEVGPGEDFTVFENVFFIGGNPSQRFMEPALVWVALHEGEWHRFPVDVVPPAGISSTPVTMDPFYYNRGFAGRNPTTGGPPDQPGQSGGDSFDISSLGIPGITWIRYIRIQSTGHNVWRDDFGRHPVQHTDMLGSLSGAGSSGFDLDAVSAVNY